MYMSYKDKGVLIYIVCVGLWIRYSMIAQSLNEQYRAIYLNVGTI